MNSRLHTGIIILAAGSSSRLAEPKQLLSFHHKTLLMRAIDAAQKVEYEKVVVILGGYYQLIYDHIKDTGVSIAYNTGWEEGMSSSIRMGLSVLLKEHHALGAVILMVCDQPFLNAEVLSALLDTANTSNKNIVASAYAGTLGTPVLVNRVYFNDLLELKGNKGAKLLLDKFKEDVASVSFEKGVTDIDTMDDYNQLKDV